MRSIRFISITALLLLLAWAQTPAQSRFGKIVEVRFGLAGGANWSALSTLQSAASGSSADYTQGWHAGAFAEIGFLFVGVRPGAYYTNAGKLFANGSQLIDPSLTDFDVTYVSVPIDVKLGIPLPVIMPYIFVGHGVS